MKKRLSVRTDLALHDFTLSELTVFPEEQTCFGPSELVLGSAGEKGKLCRGGGGGEGSV